MKKLALKQTVLPMEQKALMALRRAVRKVIKEHKLRGKPIFVWRDGKVVEIPAKDL